MTPLSEQGARMIRALLGSVRNFFAPTERPLHAIRRAVAQDVRSVAQLFGAVRLACLPYLLKLHTPEEDIWFFRNRVFAECEVWLAEKEQTIDGFIAFREDWIDHLYVRPERQRRGIGRALLECAMQERLPLRPSV